MPENHVCGLGFHCVFHPEGADRGVSLLRSEVAGRAIVLSTRVEVKIGHRGVERDRFGHRRISLSDLPSHSTSDAPEVEDESLDEVRLSASKPGSHEGAEHLG